VADMFMSAGVTNRRPGRAPPMMILRLSMLVPFLARGAAGTARSVTASGRHR
jgi:hypothetical protein